MGFVRSLRSQGIQAVSLIVYGQFDPLVGSCLERIRDELMMASIDVLDVAGVYDGILISPGSEPLVVDEVGDEIRAWFVEQGWGYVSNRESLIACVTGEPTETARELSGLLPVDPPVLISADRRAIEDEIVRYLTHQPARTVELPSTHTLVRWLPALEDRRVREPVLYRLTKPLFTRESVPWRTCAADRLSLIVRHSPEHPVSAPVAAVLAAWAWTVGNGALAQIASEVALARDPRNVLADVVGGAVGVGAHPDLWLNALKSSTLRRLRSHDRIAPPASGSRQSA